MRNTHTVATLEVSAAAYDEIAKLLREADYGHAFIDSGVIDMTGIGLTRRADRSSIPPFTLESTRARRALMNPGDAEYQCNYCLAHSDGDPKLVDLAGKSCPWCGQGVIQKLE